MSKYLSIMFSAIFFLIVLNPCQVLAASIREKQAKIGYACTASGEYSTAMGYLTTAGGNSSTAMGF
jgi:trimeric autotransporter adhesin